MTIEACGIDAGPVVVLNGDLPLIQADTVAKFAQTVDGGTYAAAALHLHAARALWLRTH